jgi:hypothetical protein
MNAALFDSTGFVRPDFRDDAARHGAVPAQQHRAADAAGLDRLRLDPYPVETVTATGAPRSRRAHEAGGADLVRRHDEPVQTIAVLLPITNKSLRNQPFLRAYLNARLRLFVQMREDSQLLNGNGTRRT